MTTSDLWIEGPSRAERLHLHGGLFGPASDVAWVLLDFIRTGRATAQPDHATSTYIETTVPGAILREVLREAETRRRKPLAEKDDQSPFQWIDTNHEYHITFIEF